MVRALAGDSTMTRCLLPLLLGADLLVDLVATVAFWFVVASRRDNRLGRRCFSRAYVVYSTNVAHHPSQPHEHKRARDTWHLHARLLGPRRCWAQGAFGGEGGIRTREGQDPYTISSRACSATPAPLRCQRHLDRAIALKWRREWDSNPRYRKPVQRFSRPSPSTARPSLPGPV